MKRIVRNITAAESTEDTRFDDLLSAVKADFDYLADGLERLARISAGDKLRALEILETLDAELSDIINQIASATITEDDKV